MIVETISDLFINFASFFIAIPQCVGYFFFSISAWVSFFFGQLVDYAISFYNSMISFIELYMYVLDIAVGWIGIPEFNWAYKMLISVWVFFVFLWVLRCIRSIVRFIL